MKTIELKNTSGKIIFTYYKEDNSIKATVLEAIRQGISLRWVDLRGTDLGGADLRQVDLRHANLRGVNLYKADLSGADLRGAYLRYTNLNNADLRGVDLSGVNLSYADLIGADLVGVHLNNTVLPIYSKWRITINTDGMIRIGCKTKSIIEWDLWFKGDEVYSTPRDTDDFKRIYANYISVREYYLLTKN